MATVHNETGNNRQQHKARELFAVVDVYNSDSHSLGTIVAVGKKRFSLYEIAQCAVRLAGGSRSGGYIPCIGVHLKVPMPVGIIVKDVHVSEIFGAESSIKSIQNPADALTNFDLDKLKDAAKGLCGCIELPSHYRGFMLDWLEDCDNKRVFALRRQVYDRWKFVEKVFVPLPAREATVRRALNIAIQRIVGP